MRTRLAPFALVALAIAAAVPLLLRCGEQAEEPADGQDTARAMVPMEYKLSGLKHVPIPCAQVGQHIPDSAQPLNGPIEISLNAATDELTVDPPVARLEKGQDLQWNSASLVWAVTFTEKKSPYVGVKMPVRGAGGAGAAPAAAQAGIPQSAACGMYHYLVAAYDPDAPETVYILDPPLYIE